MGACTMVVRAYGAFAPEHDLPGFLRDRREGLRGNHIKMEESYMATGVVKWFNGQKGFGFIQPNDGGNDVFVHISAVERAGLTGLGEGQKVSFELKTDKMRGKTSAENLALI